MRGMIWKDAWERWESMGEEERRRGERKGHIRAGWLAYKGVWTPCLLSYVRI